MTDSTPATAAWHAQLAEKVMRAFHTAPRREEAVSEPAPHVWLVLDNNGRTVAVLEDDAEFAAKVEEVNRGYGWTVKRTVVRRNREGER